MVFVVMVHVLHLVSTLRINVPTSWSFVQPALKTHWDTSSQTLSILRCLLHLVSAGPSWMVLRIPQQI